MPKTSDKVDDGRGVEESVQILHNHMFYIPDPICLCNP